MTEEKKEVAVIEYVAKDGSDVKLSPEIIKKYLVSGHPEYVTMQEFVLYIGLCKARGLNPFIKDCYLVKYTQGDSAAAIISIDFYRKRAKAQKDCLGWQNGIIVKTGDGKTEHREGTLVLDGEELLGGWFKAQPDGWREPLTWTVPLKAYIKKTKDGSPTRFWSVDNQPGQIAKVAEAQGLRKIWSDEFQGLYVDAEIQSRESQNDLNGILNRPLPVPKDENPPAPGTDPYKIQDAQKPEPDKLDESDKAPIAGEVSPLAPWNDKDVAKCVPAGNRDIPVRTCKSNKCERNEKCEAYANYLNTHEAR